jgi:hypothetical protein
MNSLILASKSEGEMRIFGPGKRGSENCLSETRSERWAKHAVKQSLVRRL